MSNPDSPNNALPAGTQVGQFIIRQALGAGGFGITYIAHDVHLNREVVIKENFPSFYASREHDTLTVCPSSTSNSDLFEKSLISFTNEAKMIASLKHPNIVSIFSIFDAYGTVFFAMPYHQGGSLSQFVKAFHQPNYTPLTEEQLRAYLIPILEALQYMHAHNVYHRDIKPDNILIDEKTGDPILIDFGAARELLDDKTQAATIVATFGFAAPEQIMALKVGPYTDLYALAATMYALMTGKIPERGDARLLFEDKHKKLSDDLLMQTRYSRPFLLSIDQALEPDWKKRPQTAQEWLDALQRKSSFWTAKRILSLAAILILVIISAIFILPSSNQNQEEIAKTPVASNQQQPITKAPATTEPPPATNPAPTKDNKTASTAKPAEPNTNTTKNNPDSFNNLEDLVDFVETTTKVNTNKALQTIEHFKTPVSQALYQANINPNAQVKANAKYFIFCWGRHLFWDQKKFQLQAATIDAAEKDPNIQFISISCRFPLTETNHNNFNDIPTILDLYTYTDQGDNDYLEAIKTDDTVKIPWNTTIEDTYKQRWKGHLRTGKVKGEFPLPDENKKIDIPGFLPTGCEPSFFILDAQGKRIFPQSMKGYGQLEDIWDAYKDISTLSEDELTLAYDKYVKTSQETQTSTNDNQVDQTLEDLKTPVSQALYQANINPDAQVKANAKYFIFCWDGALFMNQKRFQLQAATMDAAQNDPYIQFISVCDIVPANLEKIRTTIPTIININFYSDREYQSYLNALKPHISKAKIPWNNAIETTYKKQWSDRLKKGDVQGDFPMPNENKKIDIPGFVPTECSPSFFILDAQGKRIFPKNKTYDKLESMWDAYKDLSTLPEDELKLAYDRYVTTESAKTTTPNTDQAKPLDDIHKPRAWTSSKNGKKIKGQAISYDGSTVTLRINNNDVKSPKTNFIKDDQDWLNRHKEAIQQANPHKEETKSEPPTKDTADNSVAKAMEQANINGKATIKQQAKYFIIFSSLNYYMGDKDDQLQAATMDATTKDPHIQFIIEGSSIPSKETYQEGKKKNLHNIPIIPYFLNWDDYLQAIKLTSKLKIPWNASIEKSYKESWNSDLTKGKVQGPLPMPDKSKRIDIPGFTPMSGSSPDFYIIDAQGKQVFPKDNPYNYVSEIWDAYKVLTTLSEEELTQSYNKYMNTSISKEDLDWLDQHQKAIKQAKLNNSKTNKDFINNPIAHAVQQANVNRKADTKTKLKAKYFIFSFGIWTNNNIGLKRYQLLKAAMEAEEKDPNIQFVFVNDYFPLPEFYHKNSNNRPIVLDLSSCGRYYIDAIKPSSKLILPWNENIEAAHKKRWDKKLTEGTAKGAFPMPDESIQINTPGFVLTDNETGFFILDAQGKRIFPQDKNYAKFDDIWDAYKNISTITEEVLKLSYDKYVTKEPETPEKKNTEATSPSPAEAKLLEDVNKERMWTSSKNGKQITGQVIAYDGSNVTIRINNKDVKSPKTNFSNKDQDWLNQHQEAIQQAKSGREKTNGDSLNKELNENPVANAIQQLAVNRRGKAQMKLHAKYFIFCNVWKTGVDKTNTSKIKKGMLTAATINATQTDPNTQFIFITETFSTLDKYPYPKEFNNIPIIFDSYYCTADEDLELRKAGCPIKIPWNNTIEAAQKRRWESNRAAGKVRGDFAILKENRRIKIPGFHSMDMSGFYILDSQGQRIFPKKSSPTTSGELSDIWAAYTDITTLPEKELQRIYRKYVNSQLKDDD